MHDELRNKHIGPSSRDPLECAVLSVIVSGCSLILALETKIKTRQEAESAKAREKAKNGNRVRLSTMRTHLNEIQGIVSVIPKLGTFEVHNERPGIARNSITFSSDFDEERFNQNFDRMTASVGRINRLLSEIDPEGLPLTDEDVKTFVTEPIRRVQDKVIPAIHPEVDPRKRIERVLDLLRDYANLLQNLEAALASK